MRIPAIHSSITFGRELRADEIKEFETVRDSAKQLVGQTGDSIFIVHDACLPQRKEVDTGLGNLSTKDSQEFFKYMKTYLGMNTVEVLPAGEIAPCKGLYCAYTGTALSLGNHQINPQLLIGEEFEHLLTPEEFQIIVDENHKANLGEWRANYPNVIVDNSTQDKVLRIAHRRFKDLAQDSALKKEYAEFVAGNNDWLESKGIFKALMKIHGTHRFEEWGDEVDKNLYTDLVAPDVRVRRIAEIVQKNEDDIDFFKFKQFLAEKHLAIARRNLNELGLKLKGDCEIGFSADEQWAYQKAFQKKYYVGVAEWGLPSLDYDHLTDPNSEAAKLLKKKVQMCARRYDSIRFDVGWAYVNTKLFPKDGSEPISRYLGDSVLKYIEECVREVKGQDYDLHNLIYEFDGGDVFKPNSGELLDPVKSRVKVYGSTFMHENEYDVWGSNDAFLRRGWKAEEFVIGPGNHDPQPLRQIAENIADITMEEGNQHHKAGAIPPLARILKLDEASLNDPVEFTKAKWAEPMMARNNQMFYMDVFGRRERFDMQNFNLTMHPERNYAYKIPENYAQQYHEAVREGFGFNIMDSLAKVFKAKGFDITHSELYSKLIKFRDILLEHEPVIAPVVEEIQTTVQQPVQNSARNNKYLKPIILTFAGLSALVGGLKLFDLQIKSHTPQVKPQTKPRVCMDEFVAQK